MRIGDTLKGLYRVEKILTGGMGSVAICSVIEGGGMILPSRSFEKSTDVQTQAREPKRVAVKICPQSLFTGDSNSEQFVREVNINASLHPHPYLLSPTNIEELDGFAVFMEYVPNASFRAVMSRGIESQALTLLRQACVALLFLHENYGIYHRDLKPENLLVDHSRVRVADFGLSIFTRSNRSLAESGWNAGIGGTPRYMSPEHFRPEAFDSRSDIYSLGVVLYELLAGRPPFVGSYHALRRAHETQTPAKITGAPPGLWEVARRCLAKDPTDRFESFAALEAALEEAAWDAGLRPPVIERPTLAEIEEGMTAAQWSVRGYRLTRVGDTFGALAAHQRSYDLEPDGFGANMNLGAALTRVGRLEEGLRHAEQEVALFPDAPMSHIALGRAYQSRNRHRDAATCYRRAIELDPSELTARRDLFSCLIAVGDRDGAVDVVANSVLAIRTLCYSESSVRMNAPDTWINEGLMYLERGFPAVAIPFFSECIAMFPEEAVAWHDLSVALFFCGEIGRARDAARIALEAHEHPATYYLLGAIGLADAGDCGSFEFLARKFPTSPFAPVAESLCAARGDALPYLKREFLKTMNPGVFALRDYVE